MANDNKRWLSEESLKPSSSSPVLIYFEFRGKLSLITVICMNPLSPANKLIATKYCFLKVGDDTSFFFFLSFLIFVFMLFYVILLLLCFRKIYYKLIIFFMKFSFFFSRSGMFRNIPCSWFYRSPKISGEKLNLY